MRTLEQALSEHELITLRVIGEWLSLDLTGTDRSAAARMLAQTLRQYDLPQELAYLQPEEAAALRDLVAQGGRAPVAAYSRDHGEIRQMGPGKLEREEPWLDPISAAEALWYRGYIYQGFESADEGHLEYIYLPQELLAQFSAADEDEATPSGHLMAEPTAVAGAKPTQPPPQVSAERLDAVDDLTTLLALAQRTGLQAEKLAGFETLLVDADRDRRSLLLTLADELGLVNRAEGGLKPARAALDWLRQTREAQLRDMVDTWSRSLWNELCRTPGLVCEGERWENDPALARAALLSVLPRTTEWYAADDIVSLIKTHDPDFQRPDGNYDTWYIRDAESGDYLNGFGAWDWVEGRLLVYLLTGPLTWLGMVQTSTTLDGRTVYRLTDRGLSWLLDEPPAREETTLPLMVQPDATIIVSQNAGRQDRFQVARIADALPLAPGSPYLYRITPASLAMAAEQKITPERVMEFLERAGNQPVPPSVRRGIERWSERGVEGRLREMIVLHVREAGILETLRSNAKTRDYIAENLGELAVVIRRDEWEAFRQATAQLGLLLDSDQDTGT